MTRKRVPLEDRFWSMVNKRKPNECWPWTGFLDRDGYGRIRKGGRQPKLGAHRIAWQLAHGAIPDGLCVLHHCDNPFCMNPKHLFLGTHADNAQDRDNKGRQAKGDSIKLFGEKNGQAKLTREDIWAIRKDKRSQYVLGPLYGVDPTQISRIRRGVHWGWLHSEALGDSNA